MHGNTYLAVAHRFRRAAVAAFVLLASVPVSAAEPRTIQIRLDSSPVFDVLYYRADTNMSASMLGGFVGGPLYMFIAAGVQTSAEAGLDSRKRAEVRPHVAENAWQDVFVRTLSDSLAAKGIHPVWVEGKDKPGAAKADIYLSINHASYGLHLVDSTAKLVAAYVDFEAVYATRPLGPRNKPSPEHFYISGKRQVPYEELLAEPSSFSTEVELVLAQGARRLANKIAYNLK